MFRSEEIEGDISKGNFLVEVSLDRECEKMKMDKAFKEEIKIKGFLPSKKKSLGLFYKPDAILENSNSVIICESSSGGDRKVHIGELMQFLSYVNGEKESKDNVYWILFLCGNGSTSPKVLQEQKRLHFYFKNFSMKNSERKRIKGMYVTNQKNTDISNLDLSQIKKFFRIDL